MFCVHANHHSRSSDSSDSTGIVAVRSSFFGILDWTGHGNGSHASEHWKTSLSRVKATAYWDLFWDEIKLCAINPSKLALGAKM
jgi:hypothetical protein